MHDILTPSYFISSLLYSLLGVIVFWVAFIIDKLTPYDLWKGIVEDKNRTGHRRRSHVPGDRHHVAAAIHG